MYVGPWLFTQCRLVYYHDDVKSGRHDVMHSFYHFEKYSNELVVLENPRNEYNISYIFRYLPNARSSVMMTS